MQGSKSRFVITITILLFYAQAIISAGGGGTTPCSVFPKILGSIGGDTYQYQMDINADYLAMAGQTNDYRLTGSISVQPFILVSSISMSYFYWSKTMTQKTGSSFKGAQFNSDGTILVAHGFSSTAFIVVFDSETGTVITSRTYLKSYQNIRELIKSTVTGSGSSPMTYVLTQIYTTSCQGQQFFKFDSKTFSISPQWALQTIPSSSGLECHNLGLIFGRTEDQIILYSRYDGKNTISMMNSAGNWLWGYNLINGDYYYNNILAFQVIDASTDMTVATSGYTYICYSRILTSSTTPYSLLSGSQTYYDPYFFRTYLAAYEIRGLRISSLTTAKALIFGLFWGDSFLASIDFSTSKVRYKQPLFPLMAGFNNIQLAIFKTDLLFYASSNGFKLYKGQDYYGNYDYLASKLQAVVYSSDQTQSSCYTMDTSSPGSSKSMNLLQITTLSSSPFQNYPTFSFTNDISAAATVDLNLNQVTLVSSCPLKPFTISSVTQTQTTFDYVAGSAIQYFSIDPFMATANCAGYTNLWTYTGINLSNNLQLMATDLISIRSTDGQITVQQAQPAGTYFIKIVGTLPDGKTSYSASFTLNGGSSTNRFPYFSPSPLSDFSVPLMTSKTYNFPGLFDGDASDVVIISSVIDTNSGIMPSFITQIGITSLAIYPTLTTQVKIYQMAVKITDTKDTVDYNFVLTVTNQAPVVTGIIPVDLTINFGQEFLYTLPTSMDPENILCLTTIQSGPPYAQLISNTQLSLKPQNCFTDLGNKDIYIKLDDGDKNTVYSFTLKVPNRPPLFTGGQPVDQLVMLNSVLKYQLPTFVDPENCPVTVTFSPNTISSIVSVQGDTLIFSPTQPFQVGDFEIIVRLTDLQDLFTEASFNFTVYEPPKFLMAVARQLDLLASNSATYSLPVSHDTTNQYVKHDQSLPRFVTFSYPDYTFNPQSQSDLGIWTIKGKLWNQYSSVDFTFKLNVTNEAPYLQMDPPKFLIVAINTEQSLTLPKIIDRENQKVSIRTYETNHGELPLFITFNQTGFTYNIHPLVKDQPGNYSIDVRLFDSMDATSSYSFIVQVYDPYVFLASNNSVKEVKGGGEIINISGKIQNQTGIDITYIRLNILKVLREHEAIMKVEGDSQLKSDIIKLITNKSVSLTVSNDQINGTYLVQFYIITKDVSNGQIKVNILFPSPTNVSILQKPDLLTVSVLRRITSVQKGQQVVLLENTESSCEIPPQITQDIQTKVFQMLKGGRLTFTQSTPLNIFLGFLTQLIWSRFEDLSFLTINSLISLSIVGIPALIQAVLIKLIYFDILYTEMWLPQFMNKLGLNFDSIEDDQPVNVFFEENGFQSKQFLKNSGSTFIYLILYVSSWVILMLLKILSRFWNRVEPAKEKLQIVLIWKQTFNLILSQFNPMVLCSLINLYDLRFRDISNTSLVSMISSFTLLLVLSLALFLMFQVTLKGDIENAKYNAITEDLKKSSYTYRPLYLLRWTITLVTILALTQYPALQILILLLLSMMQQGYIMTKLPFQKMKQNVITLINEVGVSMYLYFDLLQTDYVESQNIDTRELKVNIAWAMSMLLVLMITINFIYAFSGLFTKSLAFLKRLYTSHKDQVVPIKPTKNQQFQEFETNQRITNTKEQVTCIDASKDDMEIISAKNPMPQGHKEFMQMFDQRYQKNDYQL